MFNELIVALIIICLRYSIRSTTATLSDQPDLSLFFFLLGNVILKNSCLQIGDIDPIALSEVNRHEMTNVD